MKEIRPMQLWKTNNGGYAFIAKVNDYGIAFGFSFNSEQEVVFREWDKYTGLCPKANLGKVLTIRPNDMALYECVYDAESYNKLDKKGIKLIADQLSLLCDKL